MDFFLVILPIVFCFTLLTNDLDFLVLMAVSIVMLDTSLSVCRPRVGLDFWPLSAKRDEERAKIRNHDFLSMFVEQKNKDHI